MPERSGHDVVVVGAGIIGLACAWRAGQRGLSVLVVDGATPGSGSSSVAAGMLAPVTEADEFTRGAASLMLIDPDGNPILIDQHAESPSTFQSRMKAG